MTSSNLYETSVLMDASVHQDPSFFMEPKPEENKNFRIIRNDIIIEGKTYKVTKAVLLIIEIMEDYLLLAQNYPQLKQDVNAKLIEMLRVYNFDSKELIINKKALELKVKKIKTSSITSKHLALSSLCLKFILYLLKSIENHVTLEGIGPLRKEL